MNSSTHARTIVCTLVGLIGVFCLLIMSPTYRFAPKGIALPSQTVRAPISPADVTLYEMMPNNVQNRVGEVRVEQAYTTDTPAARAVLFQKAKALAASLGANGLVTGLFTPGQGEDIGNLYTYIGTAVYIPASGAKQ